MTPALPHRSQSTSTKPFTGGATLILLLFLVFSAPPLACRLKPHRGVPADGGNHDTSHLRNHDGSLPVPVPPPCARVPGSFASLAQSLAPFVATLLAPPSHGSSPLLALPTVPSASAPSPHHHPGATEEQPIGTAIILDSFVVTSAHLTGDAPTLTALLPGGDTSRVTLRGTDPDLDLAVYALETPLPPPPLRDAPRLRVGDWVAVVANPFGLGPTLTAGTVRFDPSSSDLAPYHPFVAVDATVDGANWGGLVTTAGGQLVGMAIATQARVSDIALVLPAGELRRRADTLFRATTPAGAWIGLWARPIDPTTADQLRLTPARGLLVTRLVEGGPAHLAGIRQGDVLTQCHGQQLTSPAALGALISRHASQHPDQTIPISLWREGATRQVALRPAAMPQ